MITQHRILSGNGRAYIVQRGDTLSQIAERIRVPMRTLISLNGIRKPNLIFPGQFILMPAEKDPS